MRFNAKIICKCFLQCIAHWTYYLLLTWMARITYIAPIAHVDYSNCWCYSCYSYCQFCVKCYTVWSAWAVGGRPQLTLEIYLSKQEGKTPGIEAILSNIFVTMSIRQSIELSLNIIDVHWPYVMICGKKKERDVTFFD